MALRKQIEEIHKELKEDAKNVSTFTDSRSLEILKELRWAIYHYIVSGREEEFSYVVSYDEFKKTAVGHFLQESSIPYTTKDYGCSYREFFVKNEYLH